MIISGQTNWFIVIGFTLVAAWTDWRARKIPNWLTVSGFLAGIAINSYVHGWQGTKSSLEGATLALAIVLPLVLMRGLGAGDWKLMGAVGAFFGPVAFLIVLTVSILIAALMSLIEVVRQRKVKQTARNLFVLVHGFFTFGLRPNPGISLDAPGAIKLPFGVAVALATVLCYGATRWHVLL